jgi:DNA repair exonuclease SbcCD nuclease subunit
MKFVHAADIHLDSPLRGLERYEGAPVDELRGASRRALGNLVDLCLREEVDLLVIAGDLYDGDWKDYNTGLFFVKEMARLTHGGTRVVWVRGNHDAASQITKSLPLPEGAHELPTGKPTTLEFEDLGVAVHGQSYGRRDVTTDLAASYPEPLPGLFNLGILHTALDGRPGHDHYAPCTADRLAGHGYDYWALGHVHRREIISEDPWILFPGNLQGRHARETGPKGATMVTVEGGAVAYTEAYELDVVRWSDCSIDIERAASAAEAVAFDSGAPIWVEKIYFETRPEVDLDALVQGGGPIADLLSTLRGISNDPEALEQIAQALEPLAAKLPSDYRTHPEAIDLRDPKALAGLLEDVECDLLPRLLGNQV